MLAAPKKEVDRARWTTRRQRVNTRKTPEREDGKLIIDEDGGKQAKDNRKKGRDPVEEGREVLEDEGGSRGSQKRHERSWCGQKWK